MFSKILIFSGTTEGRELSKHLTDAGIHHYVSVASEYGQNMMEESEYAYVHVGKMEADEMVSYMTTNGFNSESIIVDASHPYASIVSVNIVKAAEIIGAKVIRVYRDSVSDNFEMLHYADISECAKGLDKADGNILLTTGSKEIGRFCENISEELISRLYVRVLPAIESIELCKEAGIPDKNIIAMHGPFSVEMNKALIKQYNVKHLVTKDSGVNGGTNEKLEAALALDCKCHIIDRPVNEEGITVAEAYEIITGDRIKRKITISLAGVGMGNNNTMTNEVRNCINNSDVVFGAGRLIKDISDKAVYNMYLAKDIIPVIEANDNYNRIVILFSGDTGFYSGSKKMQEELKAWSEENKFDVRISIYPGVSSIAYLASRIGESYDDAFIYSLHGRGNIQSLVNSCRYNHKCFSLLSGENNIKEICLLLASKGITGELYVGCNMSYPDEKIIKVDSSKWSDFNPSGLGIATIMIKNFAPEERPVINVKSDDEFIRDKVPMTKECIRHESIIRLGLKENDVVYDIGAGTGSVAIEIAGLSDSIKVYAIEKKPEAIQLLKENILKHNAHNIELIEGDALEVIKGINRNDSALMQGIVEKPDAVFIGGSSGELKEIIECLASYNSNIRVVINAVSLETISEINNIAGERNIKDIDIIQMSVSNVNGVGNYHLLQAQNPVMIFSFTV